jgi:hypothetical protein
MPAEEFVDDDIGGAGASRDGFCTKTAQRLEERAGIREPALVYRLRRSANG